MKNLTSLLALAVTAALPFTAFAGALDRPGAKATPAPSTPGPVGSNTSLAPGVKSFKVAGLVVQKDEKGVVVSTPLQRSKEKPSGLIYVEGDFPKGYVGSMVTCMASDSGTYDYKPTPGMQNAGLPGAIRKMTFVRW
jgi:hypothetical protein